MVFQCDWKNGGKIQRSPLNSYASLGFCVWYVITNLIPDYNINNTCIKRIKIMFQAKNGSKNTRLKGMNGFLQSELEADPTEVVGHEENLSKNLVKKVHKELQSVLDLSLLKLAQVRK